MHVVSDLTPADFLAAQPRSIHALRGTLYLSFPEPDMDTRTILSVTPKDGDPGHFTLDLSDGTSATVADFIASFDAAGQSCLRVELRNDDGSLSGDGPVLTDEIRAAFVALGVAVPVAPTPVPFHQGTIVTPETPSVDPVIESPTTPTPIAPPAPVQAHIRHAGLLHEIAFKIERGVEVFVHEIHDALERVL